jgi:prefoldin subunit 5
MMKRLVALALLLLATACMKKNADGTYRIENPVAAKPAAEKAHDNAAKSKDALDTAEKKVEQGARKLAKEAGKGLEKAGKKLQQEGQKH